MSRQVITVVEHAAVGRITGKKYLSDRRFCVQAVTTVLAECGNDIDAAIRRLTQLKIESAEQPTAAQSPAPQPAAGPSGRQQDNFRHGGEAGSSTGPQTADGWVDGLVQEMAAAKDMADAKTRATKVLHSFEQFVSERVKVRLAD